MNSDLLKLLKSVDTPTVCNAIEVALGKRGFNDFTRGTMLCSDPDGGAMVGFARTAKISALAPPTEPTDIIKTRRMAYYKHMADGPHPSVAVVEDVDFPNCIGAYWGEVNTYVHKAFGISGALTNGVMRDLGDIADDFPVVAGSIGPSHGFVHVKSVGEGARVFGLNVNDGDLIHADRHGAVIIPAEVINDLQTAIHKMMDTEKLVLDPAKAGPMTFEEFESAWSAFEKSRT